MNYRILIPFTALLVSSLSLFVGCSGGNDAGAPAIGADPVPEDDGMADIFTKDLVPTKFTAKGTALVIDFPKEAETKDIPDSEIAYLYLLQSKIIEHVDIGAEKVKAIKNPGFKEIIAEREDRLVTLNSDIGGDKYLFWINKTLGDKSFTLTNDGRGWVPRSKAHLNWALRIADTLRLDTSH